MKTVEHAGRQWTITKNPFNEGRRLVLSFDCRVGAGPSGIHTYENEESEEVARRKLRAQLLELAACATEAAAALDQP